MLSLLAFTFTLTVLPLVSTRVAAGLFILTYLTTLFSKTKPSRRSLTFSTIATIALIVASLTGQQLPTPLALLQWITLMWSVPLFSMLIGQYGRQKIIRFTLIVICFHAAWGISQFIFQRDLGLTAIGESKINIYEQAVAKIDIPHAPFKLLRAYGPYKHANSFAGVLVLGMSLLGVLRQPKPWRRLEVIIFFLLTLALATTFSRAAIFSFLLVIILNTKIFFRTKYFLLLAILVLTFLPLMFYRFSFTGSKDKAVPERINSVQWASLIIKKNNFWQGTGVGHYPDVLKNYLDSHSVSYQPWQIDFVHSVPLLVLAEWGITAVLLISAFYVLLGAYNVKLSPVTGYLPVRQAGWLLVTLSPILLTDHYFATQLSPGFFLLLTLSCLTTGKADEHLPANAALKSTKSPKPQ